jgi:putative hydrolase of the HAD superfamily
MSGAVVDRVGCVLFDLYGTLVDIRLNEDSPALWNGLAVAIRRSGGVVGNPVDVRSRFREFLGDEACRRQEGFLMEPTFNRLLASFGAADDVSQLGRTFRRLSTTDLVLRPYVKPLFELLRLHSCAIGIVSNTEAVLTRLDLDRCPLLLSADAIVLSSEVGIRKPDPRIFQIALDRMHAVAASTVVVGNSLGEDIDGARRAGLRAVYVDDSATGMESIAQDASVLRVRPAYEDLVRALELPR